MNGSLDERISRRLASAEENGQTRKMVIPRGIDLSSDDYLGLAHDPRLTKAAVAAITTEGLGSTGPRIQRGHREQFAEAERRFAHWKQAGSALLFNSRYEACLGVIASFVEEGDIVFSDQLNHPILIDGIRMARAKRIVFKHRDIGGVTRFLRGHKTRGQKFLLTESLFSADGKIAPLDKYAEICRETGTCLIVDESHAVGVFGGSGSGLIEEFNVRDSVFLSINSAENALGAAGAFVAGSEGSIQYLVQTARPFLYSTALPPAVPAALIEAISIIQDEPYLRDRLFGLVAQLRTKMTEDGIVTAYGGNDGRSPIVAFRLNGNPRYDRAVLRLRAEGFDVSLVESSNPAAETGGLKVSVNSTLTETILSDLVQCLKSMRPRRFIVRT